MQSQPYSRIRGFSLIEMMFVIVIISIITVTLVSVLQSRLGSGLAQKTASQMELILQAQAAYYADNKTQATSFAQLQSYLTLPNPSTPTNAWGYSYTLDNSSSTELKIVTQAPNTASALQLVGLLPNASCQPNQDCSGATPQVTASIPVSGSQQAVTTTVLPIFWPTSAQNGGNADVYISTPNSCPAGFQHAIIATLAPNHTDDASIYYVIPEIYSNGGYQTATHYYPVVGYQTEIMYQLPGGQQVPRDDSEGAGQFVIKLFYTIAPSPGSGKADNGGYPLSVPLMENVDNGKNTDVSINSNATTPPKGASNYGSNTFLLSQYHYNQGTSQGVAAGTNSPTKTGFNQQWGVPVSKGPAPVQENCATCASGWYIGQTYYGFIGYLTVNQWCAPNS